jgi:hypothetical protein
MKAAIRPDTFTNPIAKAKAVEKKVTDDEELLYSLSQQTGWKILEKYIGELIDGLDQINEQAIAKGMSFEDVGKNAVVLSLVKVKLKQVINKVSDAVEAVENGQR